MYYNELMQNIPQVPIASNTKNSKIIFIILGVIGGIIALPVVLFIVLVSMFNFGHDREYSKIRSEVARMAASSTIQPMTSSIDCHDVELAAQCYVQYDSYDYTAIQQMLIKQGYSITYESPNQAGFVATNTATKIEASASLNSTTKRIMAVSFRVLK